MSAGWKFELQVASDSQVPNMSPETEWVVLPSQLGGLRMMFTGP